MAMANAIKSGEKKPENIENVHGFAIVNIEN